MIIYCLTSPSNKRYVGQTVLTLNHRLSIHKSDAKYDKGTRAICNAIKKYGLDNFEKNILIECPEDEGDFWERFYVKLFNTYGEDGYNLDTGGNKNKHFKRNPEATAKMAATNRGRKNTPEAIQNMRAAALKRPRRSKVSYLKQGRKGRIPWNKGKFGYKRNNKHTQLLGPTTITKENDHVV